MLGKHRTKVKIHPYPHGSDLFADKKMAHLLLARSEKKLTGGLYTGSNNEFLKAAMLSLLQIANKLDTKYLRIALFYCLILLMVIKVYFSLYINRQMEPSSHVPVR